MNAPVSSVLHHYDFDCDWEHVNVFTHDCVTLTHVLLPQIISYSDTKVPVLVVMEYKHTSVLYVYEMIYFILQGQQRVDQFVSSTKGIVSIFYSRM